MKRWRDVFERANTQDEDDTSKGGREEKKRTTRNLNLNQDQWPPTVYTKKRKER
jgi:hypothetical protein